MNAPHPLLQNQLVTQPAPAPEDDDQINLVEYWDILVDNRWLILLVLVLALAVGSGYALFSKPVYEANMLIQVEDSSSSAKSFLGEAASLFDVKTPATAEIELIRSRMIVGQAVDNTLLYIEARPRYIPVVGQWLGRRATALSEPGALGLPGFVSGSEKISVPAFNVPQALENSRFRITAKGGGQFVLSHPELRQALAGAVNAPMVRSTPLGTITLMVSELDGKPGAEFDLVRRSRLSTMETLQENLKLTEKGRQSGVIEATLQSSDPEQMTNVLNEIGKQYVRQNIERKAAEAEKSLAFLDTQLPQFKKQLDQSEEAYSRYRNQQGTVALDEEAKLALTRAIDLQGKLLEAQQKRIEFVSRFTAEHPVVRTLDQQIASWNREIAALNARVKNLPAVQQDALRLERDVKVNNELYQSLRNNSMQLQLIREGKIGNVRVIDQAIVPEQAIKPKRVLVLGLAAALGLLGGIMLALARNAMFRGIRNAQEIEAHTGLNVYSTIPLSGAQEVLAGKALAKQPGIHVLALVSPQDPAVESLRSLRTALQFAMLEAPNNRVLITGATPGVGKSFVSVNFAAILASAGKRVLLIDADLRKGYLSHYFGKSRSGGLSEVVAGTMKLSEAIRRSVLPNLDLLTTGVLPPNPAELMISGAFTQILEELSRQYDLVIMDTPPVLVAADTVGMAQQAGTLLLVARANQTQMGELHESAKRLAHAGRNVTGVLFNAIDMSRRHYGNYAYKYGGYKYRQYRYETPTAR
ncbi:polysaccharide biosynthesis tyrosine autokinase [Caenimonas terrae]|uniref:Polysaccharide biosynthesis tyrosine autokinase n=1 Tax=Caenimonas terrae TaxID=696074 RepID=A0ABW0NGH6_9BURK